MLDSVAGVSIAVPDLHAAMQLYGQYLGYRGETRPLPAQEARALCAPLAQGVPSALLWPESGERSFIRLIETPGVPGYRPHSCFGWLAAEIIVRDLDGLAKRLAGSGFDIIGPPETLDFDFTDKIRAMQVRGPGGEVLYLTEVTGDVPGFALPQVTTEVGRIFVAVGGAPSAKDAAGQFSACTGAPVGPVIEARIEILSRALALAEGTKHRLVTLPAGGETYVEIDDMPFPAVPKPVDALGLSAGIVMVSFDGFPVGDVACIQVGATAVGNSRVADLPALGRIEWLQP